MSDGPPSDDFMKALLGHTFGTNITAPISDSRKAITAARAVLDYLANQTYDGEPLLHAIICCDFTSREHMVTALAKEIDKALFSR